MLWHSRKGLNRAQIINAHVEPVTESILSQIGKVTNLSLEAFTNSKYRSRSPREGMDEQTTLTPKAGKWEVNCNCRREFTSR